MTFETFCELWENFSDPKHKNFEDENLGIVLLEWIREERMEMKKIISEM